MPKYEYTLKYTILSNKQHKSTLQYLQCAQHLRKFALSKTHYSLYSWSPFKYIHTVDCISEVFVNSFVKSRYLYPVYEWGGIWDSRWPLIHFVLRNFSLQIFRVFIWNGLFWTWAATNVSISFILLQMPLYSLRLQTRH